jgi:molybdopterin adenylyltransferase
VKHAAVITVSSRAAAGVYDDDAGPAVAGVLRDAGFEVAEPVVVPDGVEEVATAIRGACQQGADVVVTSGGTGLHPKDVTPEATLSVVERVVPGVAEAMRAAAVAATPMGMLSRGVAGVCMGSLVVNLPGSPKAAVENLQAVVSVLDHAVDQLRGGDHPPHSGNVKSS